MKHFTAEQIRKRALRLYWANDMIKDFWGTLLAGFTIAFTLITLTLIIIITL